MDLFTPENLVALLTLTVLEVVLGIDNVIFLSILSSRLPKDEQQKARYLGLGLAMFMRIALLFSISWVMRLSAPLFSVLEHEISGRDLVLIIGGMFLLGKSTMEIHKHVELEHEEHRPGAKGAFASVLVQIAVLDIVFSLDSVITAVGMVNNLSIMVISVVIAVLLMMFFSGPVANFVEKHPTVKMLAMSFLLLIGMALVADGFGVHIPKGYIYFAIAFSMFVEALNQRRSQRSRSIAD